MRTLFIIVDILPIHLQFFTICSYLDFSHFRKEG
jgi:hypothetical protein